MFLSRVVSAVVLVPIVIGALYLGREPLLALLLVTAGLAYGEFEAMFRARRQPRLRFVGRTGTLLVVASSYFVREDIAAATLTFLLLATFIYAVFQRDAAHDSVNEWTSSIVGMVYIGWLLRYGYLLRMLPLGFQWSLSAVLITWAADTGAYLLGRAAGRHKMYVRISPGKTWEGAIGGLLLAVIASLVFSTFLLQLGTLESIFLGVAITIAGLFGDLAESMLKRAAGVKDSGVLIPGHGGVLDRLDSLLFVLPVVYYLARVFSH